jgi:hypothetical protein
MRLIAFIEELISDGYVFIAHNVSAEASCFYTMGFEPNEVKWIDNFIEFRMLTNHYHKLQYGEHYCDGKVVKIRKPRPKYMQSEEERKQRKGKLTHSYSQAVYKFCGEKIDTEHKELMRQIIISGDEELIEKNKKDILNYCESDVKYLYPIYRKMIGWYINRIRLPKEGLFEEILWRGETMARTAVIERKGYPINYEATKNFSRNVPLILREIQKNINDRFPEIGAFLIDKKTRLYVKKEKPIREWIKKEGLDGNWMLTDKKKLSLKLDAFKEHFDFRHDYPDDNFGAQMVRLLSTKQHLNGFLPAKKGKKTFWDNVGRDRIVRPYLNAYGSQSARYQPSATGYIPLKAAWMRSLIHPPKGKMIVGTDYKSQEFYLAALMSGDKNMIEAYTSGDPYLAFGKKAKVIPPDGTKETHPIERQMCKGTVLGISYSMTKVGLARKLTNDTGKLVTEDEAQEWSDLFNMAFEDYYYYKAGLIADYQAKGRLKLPDGWYMFGDNPNERSIGNCPIQGFGGAILRKAIQLIQDEGIDFILPLHDAGYILCDLNDWETVDKFNDCMIEAFNFYFEKKPKVNVGLDTEAWGDGLEEGSVLTPQGYKVKTEPVHIDERSIKEFNKFSKYFSQPDYELL